MFVYEKKLQYPVRIKNPNPALAKFIISQYGGPDGELGAHNCRKTFGRDDSVIYESTPGGVNVGAAGGAVYTQKVRPSGASASPAAVVETLVSGR